MTMAGAWSLTGVAMFSLIERETGLWLGRIGPWTPLGWPGTEVGWGLHPDAQGKGYGVEAATAGLVAAGLAVLVYVVFLTLNALAR